jgi:hypothetical protein
MVDEGLKGAVACSASMKLLPGRFTEVESGNALLHHRMPAMIETVLTMPVIRTVMDEHRENCQ